MARSSPPKLSEIKIAVIGLGYVGLPLAIEFGKTRPVIGFDIDPRRVNELREGRDRTLEVSAEELKEASHFEITSKLDDLSGINCFIVTVPTPIVQEKQPDLGMLFKACEIVGSCLAPGGVVIFELRSIQGQLRRVCTILKEFQG